jgi:hypothetical protein
MNGGVQVQSSVFGQEVGESYSIACASKALWLAKIHASPSVDGVTVEQFDGG